MPRIWTATRPAGAAAVAVVALLVGAGCGSHRPSIEQIAKSGDCIDRARHDRAAAVVRSLVARGAIPRSALAHQFAGLPTKGYLDASGELLPFKQLSADAKLVLVDWVGNLESRAGGSRIFDAEIAAATAAQRRCAAG